MTVKREVLEGDDFDLAVSLQSNPHLWPRTRGEQKVGDGGAQDEFGWTQPQSFRNTCNFSADKLCFVLDLCGCNMEISSETYASISILAGCNDPMCSWISSVACIFDLLDGRPPGNIRCSSGGCSSAGNLLIGRVVVWSLAALVCCSENILFYYDIFLAPQNNYVFFSYETKFLFYYGVFLMQLLHCRTLLDMNVPIYSSTSFKLITVRVLIFNTHRVLKERQEQTNKKPKHTLRWIFFHGEGSEPGTAFGLWMSLSAYSFL